MEPNCNSNRHLRYASVGMLWQIYHERQTVILWPQAEHVLTDTDKSTELPVFSIYVKWDLLVLPHFSFDPD